MFPTNKMYFIGVTAHLSVNFHLDVVLLACREMNGHSTNHIPEFRTEHKPLYLLFEELTDNMFYTLRPID